MAGVPQCYRKNVANVRADLRRLVKRVLLKHGYPPDKQEQAAMLPTGWAT